MKNILFIILLLTLNSCDYLSKDVEKSFKTMSSKLSELIKIEEEKGENYFKEINSKRISKYDGENSALVYYSIIEHNQIIDSLLMELNKSEKNELKQKKIIQKFNLVKNNLKNKLNLITEFDTMKNIDSLLQESYELEGLPIFALETEFYSEKFNATKGAVIILSELNEKTLNEKRIK